MENNHSTIDHYPIFNEVLLEETTYECHKHLVCCSPKQSSPRENIIMQNHMNIDTYPSTTKTSLGEDTQVALEFPPPTHHSNQDKIFEGMMTQV